VRILWEFKDGPNKDRLENTMFFIKGLPLDSAMDVSKIISDNIQLETMQQNLTEVFNTYNLGILFCTHHLPCRLSEQAFNPQQMMQMQANAAARQGVA
jgi:hypothetical protein